MVVGNRTYKSLRVKELDKIKKFCELCNKETEQSIFKNQPQNWIIVGFIPIPYSKGWDIIFRCDNCKNTTQILKNEEEEAKILDNRYKDVKSKFHKEDFMVQVECCDVCYFEDKKKFSESKWNHTIGNIVLHLCNKHKDWLKNQKFNSQKEIITKISSWYEEKNQP
jgi:hypothetical protein